MFFLSKLHLTVEIMHLHLLKLLWKPYFIKLTIFRLFDEQKYSTMMKYSQFDFSRTASNVLIAAIPFDIFLSSSMIFKKCCSMANSSIFVKFQIFKIQICQQISFAPLRTSKIRQRGEQLRIVSNIWIIWENCSFNSRQPTADILYIWT